jgi:hypothetical protein
MLCACSAFLIYLDLRWNSEIRRVPSPQPFSQKSWRTAVDIYDRKEGTCGLRAAPFGWHYLSFIWAEEWFDHSHFFSHNLLICFSFSNGTFGFSWACPNSKGEVLQPFHSYLQPHSQPKVHRRLAPLLCRLRFEPPSKTLYVSAVGEYSLLSSSKSAETFLALVSTQFPGIVISKVTSACEEAGGPTLLFILPALIFFRIFY